MNFDIYFDKSEAKLTQSDILAANDILVAQVQLLKDNLAAMSKNWGNEQADFTAVKSGLEACIDKYERLCALNASLCTFIEDYCAHVDSISNNTLGGSV